MKNFLLLLLFTTPLLFTSCGDDGPMEEVCDTSTDELLVGTWTVSGLPNAGQVTMQADGTFIDDDDIVILYAMNGVSANVKTWSRIGDEVFWSAAFESDPTETRSVSADIEEFSCTQLTFDSLLDFTFTKQ